MSLVISRDDTCREATMRRYHINAGARRNEMWRHDMASAGERAAAVP